MDFVKIESKNTINDSKSFWSMAGPITAGFLIFNAVVVLWKKIQSGEIRFRGFVKRKLGKSETESSPKEKDGHTGTGASKKRNSSLWSTLSCFKKNSDASTDEVV